MKRICSLCKIEKDLEEFYRSKIEKLGREYRCKECASKKMKKYISEDPEAWRQRSKDWREKNFKENPNFYNEKYHRFKKIDGRPTLSIEDKRKKKNARSRLNDYVKRGKIIKPTVCESCKCEDVKIQGHHENYDYPKIVNWLCRKCHIETDRKRYIREIKCQSSTIQVILR